MMLTYGFIFAIICIILGIFIINKKTTLAILSNITFKWVIERKLDADTKKESKNNGEIGTKGLKFEDNENKKHRWVGYNLTLLGSFNLLVCAVCYLTIAEPVPIAEFNGTIYVDDPKLGYILLSYQSLSLAVFIFVATLYSMNFFKRFTRKYNN